MLRQMKPQLFSLFAEAWSKGMTISNIILRFYTTGICLFKPRTILDKRSLDLDLQIGICGKRQPSNFEACGMKWLTVSWGTYMEVDKAISHHVWLQSSKI